MSLLQQVGRMFGARYYGPNLGTAESPADIKTAILAYLRTHRTWYARWSRFYSLAWNIATLLIVVLGALASILTALQAGGQYKVPDWLLITLPAVSSLLAALLVQFKLKEACRLRELGRIASEELICKAFLIPAGDSESTLRAAIELREAAHRLEREQLAEFLTEPSSSKRPAEGKPTG